jgi:uncharacterized protein YkwD
MKRRLYSPVLAVLATLAGCAPHPAVREAKSGLYGRIDDRGAAFDEASAISLVNAYRARRGQPALTRDAGLSVLAREQAARAGREDRSVFGEVPNLTGPGGTGLRLSAGYLTVAEAFSGWRDVPVHERAMLNSEARRIGIAAVHVPGSKYRVYWALATAP